MDAPAFARKTHDPCIHRADADVRTQQDAREGRSLHVQGRLDDKVDAALDERMIPACTGQTCIHADSCGSAWDDPCMYRADICLASQP